MDARPHLLVVAGHDPSGAGVEADREAAASLDVHAHTIITARTEQDDHGVYAVGARPAGAWFGEALTALHVQPAPGALKLGLLPGVEHVRCAVELARAAREAALPVVVDPVISASSGRRFLFAGAVHVLAHELCAEPVIVTPNLPEAAELTDMPLGTLVESEAARIDAARRLLDLGCGAVVLKGGHGLGDTVVDLLVRRDQDPVQLVRPRVPGGGIRGSGCRFASCLAASLALGEPLEEATRGAGAWVGERIAQAAPRRSGGSEASAGG
jgi:hydroxymethylpyrimidine/phosphomethylpyrimidine kinase